MGFKFASQKLLNGLFEPEGIYLTPPFEGDVTVLQGWGDNPQAHSAWRYNGVPLKGHPGIDVALPVGARILAMDAGKVVEISIERGGFERYIKIEHRWGESLYANLGDVLVETGQSVARGDALAHAGPLLPTVPPVLASAAAPGRPPVFLHFAVRIQPFNRYDGWGGFSDPLPYMPPGAVLLSDDGSLAASARATNGTPLHPMADDRPGLRRP
jgi:hypothetical protein